MTRTTSRARLAVVFCAGAPVSVFALLSCGEEASHIYGGRQYVAARDCLDRSLTIDVVEGPDPGNCEPVCLIGKANVVDAPPDAGVALYVSAMCRPFPRGFDASSTSAECTKAIAAAVRGDGCTADGGSTNPLPRLDAGDGG